MFLERMTQVMSVTADIDQFTLILQPTSLLFDFEDWEKWKADSIVNIFLDKSGLELLFGAVEEADGGILKNYTKGYTFLDVPFYFRIAYHPIYVNMGVSVYFSAYAWSEYRKRYEEYFKKTIHLHTFLQIIHSSDYSYRLSRIDMVIDFKNEGVDIAKIYRSLQAGRTEVRYNHE